MRYSNRLDRIQEYVFARLAREVRATEERTGRKVLNLGPGSPDVAPSTLYVAKLKEYVDGKGAHLYPGYGAIPEFREGVQEWYRSRYAVELGAEEIAPLLGAKDGVTHLPLTLLDEGDEVLMPDPGYPAYADSVRLTGGVPVFYALTEENGFGLDVHEIETKISSRTKFVWVNFPHNPTGGTVGTKELEALVRLAKEKGVLIAYDNAYSEITFDGFRAPSILEVPGAKEVAIELGSLSKTFSFAGYRIGYVAGNRETVQALAKMKSQFDSGLSLPLQRLAGYALSHPDREWQERAIQAYDERRRIIGGHLAKLGLVFTLPKGGLYIWARIPDEARDAGTFAMDLLKEKQVLLTPGSAFGKNGERYVRASICSDITNIQEYF